MIWVNKGEAPPPSLNCITATENTSQLKLPCWELSHTDTSYDVSCLCLHIRYLPIVVFLYYSTTVLLIEGVPL